MTFQVPASKASIGQDQFEFTIGEDTYRVKRLKFLPIGRRLDIAGDVDGMLNLFGEKGTKQGDAVRELDQDQFDALTTAWQNDSDVTLGESEASSS